MPTTNISTVGTGGNYTTWTLWEAATDNDLVATDVIERGDGLTETLTTAAFTLTGAVTDATRYRILQSQTSHAGVFGAGHQIQLGGATITLGEANAVMRDLTVRHNAASGAGSLSISALTYLQRCFVVADVGSQLTYAIYSTGGGHIRSCCVIGLNVGIACDGTAANEVSNCTVIGRSNLNNTAVPASGIRNIGTGVITAKNNVVDGFNQDFLGTLTQTNNSSRDGTAAGAGSLVAQVHSDTRFRSGAALDFHPLSSSALAGAGADLSANFNYDISNTAMPSSWPIGAFRPVAAPTFAGLTSATDNADGSVALAWSAATANVSAIRGYKIHVHTAAMVDADLDADTYLLEEVPAGDTGVDVFLTADGTTKLTVGTLYYFAVRAVSMEDDEDQNATNKSATVTSGVTAPSAGINGYLGSIAGTTLTAALDAIPATNRDRWRVGYRIKNDEAANNWTYSSASTNISAGATIAITGLTAERVYEFFFQAGNGASTWGDPGEIIWVFTSDAANTWDGSEITERIMALIDDNLTSSLSLTRKTQYGDLKDYPPAGRDLTSHLPMCLVKLQGGVPSKLVAFPNTRDLVYSYRIVYAAEYTSSSTVYKNRVDSVGKLHGLFASFKQLGFAGGKTVQGTVGWTKLNADPDPPENNLHRHDQIYVVALTLEVYCRAHG